LKYLGVKEMMVSVDINKGGVDMFDGKEDGLVHMAPIEVVAEPAETVAHDKHFPFDWNGWGIGIDGHPIAPERRPGESIVAWQLGVRTITDGC
jgi:hypothetical protein